VRAARIPITTFFFAKWTHFRWKSAFFDLPLPLPSIFGNKEIKIEQMQIKEPKNKPAFQ
jgi:hypothetical protein